MMVSTAFFHRTHGKKREFDKAPRQLYFACKRNLQYQEVPCGALGLFSASFWQRF